MKLDALGPDFNCKTPVISCDLLCFAKFRPDTLPDRPRPLRGIGELRKPCQEAERTLQISSNLEHNET